MNGQDALDKPAALLGVGALAQLAHDDAVPNDLLRGVVRRRHALDAHERPQCSGVLEELVARFSRFGV